MVEINNKIRRGRMFKYKNILEKRKEYLIGGKNNDKSIIEYFEDESSQIIKKLNEIVHNLSLIHI